MTADQTPTLTKPCERCDGTGNDWFLRYHRCDDCHGMGWIGTTEGPPIRKRRRRPRREPRVASWMENCDGTRSDQVGQSDYGTFWVARRNERQPEVAWTLRFRRWDPRCWRAWFNSARRGECTFLEEL